MARAPGLRPQTPWEDGPPRLPKACGDERSAGPTGAAATAPLCRRGKPPPFKPRGTAANTEHACCHPNSADPASVSCSVPQASSSRERVWSPAGARGAGRTAVTREKSSLLGMQLAAEGKTRAPPAAPDGWASSGSSCSHFPAVEALLSEHPSALRSRVLSPLLASSPRQVLPAAVTIVLGTTAEADVSPRSVSAPPPRPSSGAATSCITDFPPRRV